MKPILLLCLLAFALAFQSQPKAPFDVINSGPVKNIKKFKYIREIESDSTGFYLLRCPGDSPETEMYLQKFSAVSGELVYEKPIPFPVLKGDLGLVAEYNRNGKIFMFVEEDNAKENTDNLIMMEIDAATGNAVRSPVVIANIQREHRRRFFVRFSPDGKKFMVIRQQYPEGKAQIVSATLYDATTYKKIGENKQPADNDAASPIECTDYLVDNAGRFIYLYKIVALTDPALGDPAYKYRGRRFGIGIVQENSTENKLVRIPSVKGGTTYETYANKYITISLLNNELVCSGQVARGDTSIGFFFLNIDPARAECNTQSYEPLSKELKSKLTYRMPKVPKSFAEKMYWPLKTVYINGSYYVIKYHGNYSQAANGTPLINYSFMELLILKYNNKGGLDWMRVLPRNAMPDAMMVKVTESTRQLNIFYYDSPKNIAATSNLLDPLTTIKNCSYIYIEPGYLTCATVDEEGYIKRRQFPSDKDQILINDNGKDVHWGKNAFIANGETDKAESNFSVIKISE